jgi:nucleoside 2-deoxyribosyltransferase
MLPYSKRQVHNMTLKFYIGSSFQNIDTVRKLASTLVLSGFTWTYDWTKNKRAADDQQLKLIAEEEVRGIQESGIVIILLPGGKGTHTELGLAIAGDKRVYLYDLENRWNDQDPKVAFYHLKSVTIIKGDLEDLITKVKEAAVEASAAMAGER